VTRVALVTYSTKPRGGVVHTLGLADALCRLGRPTTIVALGEPGSALFRPTEAATVIVPAPPKAAELERRVFDSVDRLAEGLASCRSAFDILHTQDCIAARAATRVRDNGAAVAVVRTVHHVDDFTTPALVDCQRRAIIEPDRLLVVSEHWRRALRHDYGVDSEVVPNGVDATRFGPISSERRANLRRRLGPGDPFVFLGVGGIEPRKGSVHLLAALARLKRRLGEGSERPAVLVVVGGHSFQDHAAYREDALARLPGLGLELGTDVVLLGTVSDDELAGWYRAADALAFPSVKEGWGLAVLEALSADLPVVASDIPVFREYLDDGHSALMPAVGDPDALAVAMHRLVVDPDLRSRLRRNGRVVAGGYTWATSAVRHAGIYDEVGRELLSAPAGPTAPERSHTSS
jgi:glycosyltransferase-like protein